MKPVIFFFCFSLLLGNAYAQNSDRFMSAMKKNIAAFDSSFGSVAGLQSLGNSFERIANAEKNQWLPYYYAAFCQVNSGFMMNDAAKNDQVADRAEQLISKADSLNPMNSEVSCLRSMIATLRLMVNPMQRYMQYGVESENHLKAAMARDSTNPRPYFLRGQSLKYTPEQFGGGCKTAMPILEAAMEKFAGFKPASEIHPAWGREQAEKILQECK